MSNLPENYAYSEDHEWINASADEDLAGKTVRVGITSVATDRLGEVVFAELPEVDDTITAGEQAGEWSPPSPSPTSTPRCPAP